MCCPKLSLAYESIARASKHPYAKSIVSIKALLEGDMEYSVVGTRISKTLVLTVGHIDRPEGIKHIYLTRAGLHKPEIKGYEVYKDTKMAAAGEIATDLAVLHCPGLIEDEGIPIAPIVPLTEISHDKEIEFQFLPRTSFFSQEGGGSQGDLLQVLSAPINTASLKKLLRDNYYHISSPSFLSVADCFMCPFDRASRGFCFPGCSGSPVFVKDKLVGVFAKVKHEMDARGQFSKSYLFNDLGNPSVQKFIGDMIAKYDAD